jgi:hypothetical protein
MMIDLDILMADFAASAELAAIDGWPCPLRWEVLRAPHEPPALRQGFGAVYAFALSSAASQLLAATLFAHESAAFSVHVLAT